MLRVLARAALVAGLALGAPLALAGPAFAADYGHVSGSGNPGRVVVAVEHSPHCNDGPRFVVRNNRSEPAAKQDSGPLGTFVVCVTPAAFDAHPVGTWFNNLAGTGGPVG